MNQNAESVAPEAVRLNRLMAAIMESWGFVPLSVRYAAALEADRQIAQWVAQIDGSRRMCGDTGCPDWEMPHAEHIDGSEPK